MRRFLLFSCFLGFSLASLAQQTSATAQKTAPEPGVQAVEVPTGNGPEIRSETAATLGGTVTTAPVSGSQTGGNTLKTEAILPSTANKSSQKKDD